jgi:hypothetical protein
MRASRRAATFLLLAASYRFCGKRGARQGVSGAQRGLRHEGGAVQESEEGRDKREGESCWKSGGGRVRLYTWGKAGAGRWTRRAVRAVTGPLDRIAYFTGTFLTRCRRNTL